MKSDEETTLEFSDNYGLFFEGGRSPLRFFRDCLSDAILYKRAAGYFSSSVFLAINESLIKFISRNGMIKLVCSPRLMPEDLEQLRSGVANRLIYDEAVKREIVELLENSQSRSATKILGLLVASGNLEIRIAAKQSTGAGIFHSKVGIFQDSNSGKVAFIGSTNETWSGWSELGNAESFMAKSTYRGPESKQDVEDLERYFDDLWQNRVHGLDVSSLGETSQKILEENSRTENLKDLIEDAQRVFLEAKSISGKQRSSSKTLMKHQIDVIKSWQQSSCVGIVDHATGSGKTITALRVISEWIKTGRPALVIVPSTLLQKQWKSEISQEIGISPLMVGGENANRSNWMMTLSDNTRSDRDFGPRITLAVLASASGRDFVQRLKVSQDLLVVADEVHTTGQTQSRDLLDKLSLAGGKLGLSATYSRYGDQEGTKKIEECFGKPLPPKFTISDAIKAGRLVPYDYHFGKVALTSTELSAYEQVSEEIKRIYARESDKTEFSKLSWYLKKLIFKRAKILKSAERKVYFAKEVVQANYKNSDRWLVYCDDSNQMESLENLMSGLRVPILKYFDAMAGDKSETLRVFAQEGGVLLAIKCLDEGIDIPSATHALILASSQNPREYIQRRGRVLRSDLSSGKRKAVIWDSVAVDEDGVPITEVELVRMQEFAGDATNSMVHVELLDLISHYNTKRGGSIEFITEDGLENNDDQDIVTL